MRSDALPEAAVSGVARALYLLQGRVADPQSVREQSGKREKQVLEEESVYRGEESATRHQGGEAHGTYAVLHLQRYGHVARRFILLYMIRWVAASPRCSKPWGRGHDAEGFGSEDIALNV